MKTCSKCKVSKGGAEFWANPSSKDGLKSSCKECDRAYHKTYCEENCKEISACQKAYREKHRKEAPAKRRGSKYGLTPADFGGMVKAQGGLCAICSGPGGRRGLCVDHDHSTRKVRRLLCHSCNVALGLFKDSSAIVQIAADYLKRHGK